MKIRSIFWIITLLLNIYLSSISVNSQSCPLTVVNQWGVSGDPDITPGTFTFPFGISFDSSGILWITELSKPWIQSFDALNGNYLSRFATADGNPDIGTI